MKEVLTSVSPGPGAQFVMFLTTDLVVASLILARSHTLVEINHEKFMDILLLLLIQVTSASLCPIKVLVR